MLALKMTFQNLNIWPDFLGNSRQCDSIYKTQNIFNTLRFPFAIKLLIYIHKYTRASKTDNLTVLFPLRLLFILIMAAFSQGSLYQGLYSNTFIFHTSRCMFDQFMASWFMVFCSDEVIDTLISDIA